MRNKQQNKVELIDRIFESCSDIANIAHPEFLSNLSDVHLIGVMDTEQGMEACAPLDGNAQIHVRRRNCAGFEYLASFEKLDYALEACEMLMVDFCPSAEFQMLRGGKVAA